MAKKFVTLTHNNKRYRMFLDDIRSAHKKIKRNIPPVPSFHIHDGSLIHSDEEETDGC